MPIAFATSNQDSPISFSTTFCVCVIEISGQDVCTRCVDGHGTSDDGAMCFGIELFCQLDPISVFWAIADRVDGNNAETCVQNAADALKAISSSYVKVLEFVYEMVTDVCLSETCSHRPGALLAWCLSGCLFNLLSP